ELLQQRQSARADEDALEKQLSRLQAAMPPQPAEAGGTDEQLMRLRANLLRWLAAPSVERRRPAWSWGVALALTTAVVLAGSLGVSGDVLLVLAGATGAWLLITWLAVRPLASTVRAQIEAETLRAQAQYGVVVPVSWEHAEVADRVASLADELAERGRLTAARLQSAEAQRGIAADLESARGKVLKAEQELDALRARFGFAVGPTVALSAWLHAVRDRHRLKTALAGVQVEGGTLDKRVKHTRAELLAFLAGAGRETLATSPTAEGVGEQRGDQLRAALRSVA